jgi:hypothetical protein
VVTESLRRTVYTGEGYKPFAELTRADVESLAAELSAVARTGPLARVAPVARAWSELGRALGEAGAARVGELEPEVALEFAQRVWVAPRKLL